jgi:starch synthase
LLASYILASHTYNSFNYAGLPVYFIEPHHPDKFFWRGKFYGEQDDFKRFSFFSRVALEFLLQAGKKPDIIHCHDWQTAFVVWTL